MNTGEKRIRIAVLWVAFTAASAVSLLLWLLVEPTALAEALAGEMEGMASGGAVGYYLALSAVLPLGLAVMTLLLGNQVTRYTNLIAGLLLGAWGLVDLVSHLAGGAFNASMLISVLTSLIAFLIAGLSLGELRTPDSQPTITAPKPRADVGENANA